MGCLSQLVTWGEKSVCCRNFCVIEEPEITSVCLFVIVNKENREKLEILEVVLG